MMMYYGKQQYINRYYINILLLLYVLLYKMSVLYRHDTNDDDDDEQQFVKKSGFLLMMRYFDLLLLLQLHLELHRHPTYPLLLLRQIRCLLLYSSVWNALRPLSVSVSVYYCCTDHCYTANLAGMRRNRCRFGTKTQSSAVVQ